MAILWQTEEEDQMYQPDDPEDPSSSKNTTAFSLAQKKERWLTKQT